MKVAIIGAGRIGKAIQYLLREYDGEIVVWDVDESLLEEPMSLKQVVSGAEVVFLGIPSWTVRGALEDIVPHMTTRGLFVALTKGLEPETHATVDVVLQEGLGADHDFALLSGPMMAEEIMKDMRAGAVVATPKKESYNIISTLFQDTKLLLEYSDNIHAVALAAVLKNVYALGFGIIDGLGLSGNDKGIVFAQMFQEQMGIQAKLQGDPKVSLGLAGLGDMVCTGFSAFSRQRTTGEELIRTGTVSKKSESMNSLPSLLALLGTKVEAFPFLQAIQHIVIDKQPAKQVMNNYFIQG